MAFILFYLLMGGLVASIIAVTIAQSIFYKPTMLLMFVVMFLWPLYLGALIWDWIRRG